MRLITELFNEYGAGQTSILEDLDAYMRPLKDALQTWGMETRITPHEWSVLRIYVVRAAGWEVGMPAITGAVPLGLDDTKVLQALTLGHRFMTALDAWFARYPQLQEFERQLARHWMLGIIHCVGAEVQIRKAMALYREQYPRGGK